MEPVNIPLTGLRHRATVLASQLFGGRRGLLHAHLLVCCLAVVAQAQSPGEYRLKAAFLFNFSKFVDWPADAFTNAEAPLQICVIGQDPFGAEFAQSVTNKIVNGHRIELVHPKDVHEARACQILFIAVSEKKRIPEILQGLKGTSVLTVADIPNFVETGGIINFILDQDRVRFEINLKAAEVAHLKLSARLLTVAKLVLSGDN